MIMKLVSIVFVISCATLVSASYEDKRCKCVCPSPAAVLNNNGTDRKLYIGNVPPNKCWEVPNQTVSYQQFMITGGILHLSKMSVAKKKMLNLSFFTPLDQQCHSFGLRVKTVALCLWLTFYALLVYCGVPETSSSGRAYYFAENFVKLTELHFSNNCDGVILPRVGELIKGREQEFCPRCECKYENRNTTIIKVVVIIVIWVIMLLVAYMGFLICLDPLINKRAKASYQEHTNEDDESTISGTSQQMGTRGNVLNRVTHQQDKWKRQVREQRRNIYDRHTMLN